MITALEKLVQEVAEVIGGQRLDGLLIVGEEVNTIFLIGGDGVNPEVVLLGVHVNLLEHVLLGLSQLVGIDGLLHLGNAFVQQADGNLLLIGVHGAVALQGSLRLVGAEVEVTGSATRVGSALVLADGLQIDHGENLTNGIQLHGVLQGVRHIGVPVLHSDGLGRLGLHLEVVDYLALGKGHNLLEVLSLLLGSGQRSDVLLNERTEGLLVEVTSEDEGELGSILIAVLGNLQDAVVVDVLQVLHLDVGEAGVVRIQREAQ